MKNNAGSNWTIITDKCENVEGVMQWLDFTLSDKGIALTGWGMPNEVQSYKKMCIRDSPWGVSSRLQPLRGLRFRTALR